MGEDLDRRRSGRPVVGESVGSVPMGPEAEVLD